MCRLQPSSYACDGVLPHCTKKCRSVLSSSLIATFFAFHIRSIHVGVQVWGMAVAHAVLQGKHHDNVVSSCIPTQCGDMHLITHDHQCQLQFFALVQELSTHPCHVQACLRRGTDDFYKIPFTSRFPTAITCATTFTCVPLFGCWCWQSSSSCINCIEPMFIVFTSPKANCVPELEPVAVILISYSICCVSRWPVGAGRPDVGLTGYILMPLRSPVPT